jgi:TM2 domain-containing membrane protein YozV
MIRVTCPRCNTRFTTSDANAGKTGQCPKCGNPIRVPKGGSPEPEPAEEAAGAPPADPPAAAEAARPAPRPAPRPRPEPAPEPAEAAPTPDETAALPMAKSKTVALLLCIFLGVLGAHRFYMGSWGWGLVILGLDLTCIGGPIFALVDIIRLALMDRAEFEERYSETVVQPFTF